MEFLKPIISTMAYASLAFTATAAYLRINKIWIRKHHAEVADSVSIAGSVIYIIPLTLYAVNYIFIGHWQGFLDAIIWISASTVSILIGSRLWVQDHRHKTFWVRLKEALRLERSGCNPTETSLPGNVVRSPHLRQSRLPRRSHTDLVSVHPSAPGPCSKDRSGYHRGSCV